MEMQREVTSSEDLFWSQIGVGTDQNKMDFVRENWVMQVG